MKLLPPIRKRIKKYLSSKKLIIGYVEQIEPGRIYGWVIHKKSAALNIELRIERKIQSTQTYWVDRLDVAAIHGYKNNRCGFEIILPEETKNTLKEAMSRGKSIEVLANKTLLPCLESTKISTSTTAFGLEPEILDIAYENPEFSSTLESLGHFTAKGLLETKDDIPIKCELVCNGKTLECPVVLQEYSVLPRSRATTKKKKYQFDIELPGCMWEAVPNDSACHITIKFNDVAIHPDPLEISRERACVWIKDIAHMGKINDTQYRTLLALEHIHQGNFLPQLEQKVAAHMAAFAEAMQLVDLTADTTLAPKTDLPTESPSTLLLWKALRTLNARIQDNQTKIFDDVEWVIKELRLGTKDRDRLFHSVLPLLCKTNEFFLAKGQLNLAHYERMANSQNTWEITLAIPVLLSHQLTSKAIETVYRAIEYINNGWINTECIFFSVKLIRQLEQDLEITSSEAEKFRYAVIALLDGFYGEWFSRLHDSNLIASLADMVANIDHFTDYHRKDIIAAAQRIYGLNPAFWQQLNQLEAINLDIELNVCQAYFNKLQKILNSCDSLHNGSGLDDVFEALSYFIHKKNPEAIIYLREICANNLAKFNHSFTKEGKALVQQLLLNDPTEALRIAAFPLPSENLMLPCFAETSPEKLRETIRQATEPTKSVMSFIQERASKYLDNLLHTHQSPQSTPETVKKALDDLLKNLIALDTWDAHFLSFDILSSAYVIAYERQFDCHFLLMIMEKILQKAIVETKDDWFLSPTILSGLAHLSGQCNSNKDPYLQGFLTECRNSIQNKFQHRLDDLLNPPFSIQFKTGSVGWPKDTLVIIYSCRKYLDTRVNTIRKTWVQNLVRRKIPYLVLVGDGDDTIQGDILSLDVSDHYEDLPKKTLKLFDWIYHNTDAQYVLKIDDDCYLDVDRFFDTLSYRKHFYYGRVIKRGIGGTDRIWHQKKSHTLRGQKSIDKSPEPSIYADGGGGYTLSRLAIKQLLEASNSTEGKRLIMHSFMEDKLVGDLLSLSYIEPSNEDYGSYQRRRTFDKALPVAMWENTFFPCLATPTKMTHLDSESGFEQIYNNINSKELWPKKIWPTCWHPGIKLNNNQLELLSDTSKVNKLMAHNLILIAVIRNEITLLPHFLAHYRNLGVLNFTFIDNCSDDGSREYLIDQPDVVLFSSDTEYKYSHYGVAWQQAILGNYCLGKWVLLADADEFLIFEDCETKNINQLVKEIETENCDAACIYMVDMYPEGKLEEADFKIQPPFQAAPMFDNPPVQSWHLGSGWFSNSSSTTSHLRHRIVPNAVPHDFVSQKYALFKHAPWVRVSQGVHYASNLSLSRQKLWFAHFKYHAGFKEKVETEIKRKQHFNNAAEYNRYMSMLYETKGGFYKEGLSTQYTSSSKILQNYQ